MLYPLLFEPILKEKIWGGQLLKYKYGMELPGDRIGESWSMACHSNGRSIISNGSLRGKSLLELIDIFGRDLLGTSLENEYIQRFPLLIKLIDAQDVLSLQVHPDDTYAAVHEKGESGKSEMWYILEAKPGAYLYYGIKPGVTREEFRNAAISGDVESLVCRMEVKKGDAVYIPAGMVHAIGDGILIYEVQQNSDTTYRVFDWNRTGDDGRKRELHLDKALEVIDFDNRYPIKKTEGLTLQENGSSRTFYAACPYFALEKLQVNGGIIEDTRGEKFFALTIAEGEGQIRYTGGSQGVKGGDTCLIPAKLNSFAIEGNCTVLKAYVPDKVKDIILPLKEKGCSQEQLRLISGLFD